MFNPGDKVVADRNIGSIIKQGNTYTIDEIYTGRHNQTFIKVKEVQRPHKIRPDVFKLDTYHIHSPLIKPIRDYAFKVPQGTSYDIIKQLHKVLADNDQEVFEGTLNSRDYFSPCVTYDEDSDEWSGIEGPPHDVSLLSIDDFIAKFSLQDPLYSPNDGVIRVDTAEELNQLFNLWGITDYILMESFPFVVGNNRHQKSITNSTTCLTHYTNSKEYIADFSYTFKNYLKTKEPTTMEPLEPQIRILQHTDVKDGDTVTICTEEQFIELHGKDWRTAETLYGGWNPELDKLFGCTYRVKSKENEYFFTATDHPDGIALSFSMCVGYGTPTTSSTSRSKVSGAPTKPSKPSKPVPPKQFRKFLPKKKDPSPAEVWKGLCTMGKKEGWEPATPTDLFIQCLKEGLPKIQHKVEFVENITASMKTSLSTEITQAATAEKVANTNEAFLLYHLASRTVDGVEAETIRAILSTSKNPSIKKELNPDFLYSPLKRLSSNYRADILDSIFDNLVIERSGNEFKCQNTADLKSLLSDRVKAVMDTESIYSITPTTKINIKV